jgi:ribose-phosphate pyrophosphokinase
MPGGDRTPCLFAFEEGRAFAAKVSEQAGIALGGLEERRFEGGEFKLRPLESVRDRTSFVVQSLIDSDEAPVASRLLRLLFLLQGLRDGGSPQRIAVLPYLAFARKDRRTQLHDPVTSRYVAELLEAAGASHVVALDVHNPAAFDNAFRVPVDHLSALPMFVDHFAQHLAVPICVASPDIGGIKRAQLFRELLAHRLGGPVDLVFLEKRRALGMVSGGALVGEVRGSSVIIIDDLCATGGSLLRAAQACQGDGAARVHVAVTHAVLAAGLERLSAEGSITEVVITDSAVVPGSSAARTASGGRIRLLSVAPLFAAAIRRICMGRPLDPLWSHWPLRPED